MQITLKPEHEAKLSQLAAQSGRSIDDLVHRAIDRYALYVAAEVDPTLFFDEADALFGRRTNVQDSHDRYANQDDDNPKKL